MADGTPDDGPSLEMPSLSLRRRSRAREGRPPAPTGGASAAGPAAGPPQPSLPPQPSEPSQPSLPRRPSEPSEPSRPSARRGPREGRTIRLGGLPAAAVTGVLVGGLAVLLGWLAAAGCSAARGTSSCGGAAGLPILLATLVALAWAGTLLLRACGVADAGSTSLLAVGVLAVLVMVFLLGSLDEWWGVLAVPVASLVAYAGSWWVTTAVGGGEPAVGGSAPHDVR
ncbi:hypothetical protein [Nocardioides xinjiangensis]|uniref:hypothetical protein n=1 Tax=Nocardioides xinjiangensis TaxID=2817376 RepID=UPI001B308E99|nr:MULTISPECIES: hypothetical protein [unclassified Nocardioides]